MKTIVNLFDFKEMISRIGHRGAKGYVTENTLASFKKALQLNVDAIELDVHCCASGELIVFHDFTLDRLTNIIGSISQFNLVELKQLKINNQFTIPTLEEVLDLIDNNCKVNIELKGKNTAKPVYDLLQKKINKSNWDYADFIISSFQYNELQMFTNFNSNFPLAILTQASVEQSIQWAKELEASAIHPHFSLLTIENCKEAKDLELQINTWTVNEPSDIKHIKRFPIDGIISDFPDRI